MNVTLSEREIIALNLVLKAFWAESVRDWQYENASGWDYEKARDSDHIVSDLIALKHLSDRVSEVKEVSEVSEVKEVKEVKEG